MGMMKMTNKKQQQQRQRQRQRQRQQHLQLHPYHRMGQELWEC